MRSVRDKHINGGRNGGGGGGRILRLDDRLQLHDLKLERDVLYAFLVHPRLIVPSEVIVTDFYAGPHELIFSAILHLLADGGESAVSIQSLRGAMYDAGTLRAIGGDDYIDRLTEGLPLTDVDTKRLRRLARRRRVHEAAAMVSVKAGTDELPSYLAELDRAARELDGLDGPRSPIPWCTTSEIFAPLGAAPWVVPALHLGPGRPGMLAGYGSSAKTLIAQALGLAVASGTPAWGHFAVPAPGVVRHLDYEQGRRATSRRYQRLALGMGIDAARLGTRLQYAAFPTVFLDSVGAYDAYARACEGASLVILDALRGATPTMDENDSSIRTCLDQLSRVSEAVGCAFLVLHHAGKPKDNAGAAADLRTVMRGSSAIFDACGAVFLVQSGANRDDPRKVTEVKPPADAEGSAIEPFALQVLDVEIGGDPTGGVRVAWEATSAPSPVAAAGARMQAKLDRLAELVAANPGESSNVLAELAKPMARSTALTLLRKLETAGRVTSTVGDRNTRSYRAVVQP